MPTFTERFRAAVSTFQQPTPSRPVEGEVSYADPKRLFPGGWYRQYNPSVLVTRKGLRLFDEMRTDDQIKAALAFKKHAVLSTAWEVRSPEGMPDDWAPTRFAKYALEQIEGALISVLLQVMTGLDYGYSVTEKVWQVIQAGEWAGYVGLKALKTRRPHEFAFDLDEYGNLKPDGVIQSQPSGDKHLPADKFVLFSNDLEFSNIYGRSDLEAAYRPWWTKDNAYKWLAILLERLGIPPVLAMYDPTKYTGPIVDSLKKAVENIQAATFGIIPRPNADALEFWTPELAGQATRVFVPSLDMFNRDIARALLMPGLLGMTADTAEGSFARAKVHFDVFMLVITKLRITLKDEVVQEQIIKPLVDVNFPSVDAYPIWDLLPITDEVRTDLLDRWLAAVEKGTVTPQQDDEDHIRQVLSFPARQTPEPQVNRPTEVFQVRTPNRFEKQVNFARIERDLDGVETEARTQLQAILEDAREEMVLYVSRNWDRGVALADTLKLTKMGDLQDGVSEFLRAAYGVGVSSARDEFAKMFSRTYQSGFFTPREALRYFARKAVLISGILRDRLVEDGKRVILNAMKFGEPQRETIQKLRDLFEPYLGDPTVIRDDEAVAPYRLETVLRTNATEAFNQGRLIAARDPEVAPFIRGMEYSAVVDSRTTAVCRYLDGRVFKMSEPELDRLSPPNHWGCRSLVVAIPPGVQIDEDRFITAAEIGRAEDLAGEGFK